MQGHGGILGIMDEVIKTLSTRFHVFANECIKKVKQGYRKKKEKQ